MRFRSFALAFLMFQGVALAHFDGTPAANDPPPKWWKSLYSIGGAFCCAQADGQDAIWDTGGRIDKDFSGYRVKLDGEWQDVKSAAVVTVPNLHKRAVVWIYYEDGKPLVRCFIPGSLT